MPPAGAGARCIGLMSGTSLDGVDGVLVQWSDHAMMVLAHSYLPFPSELAQELLALNTPDGVNELHRAALAGNELTRLYAQVTKATLTQANLSPNQILAVGVHGQTIRHRPQAFDGTGYTLQLNNPALLAELCGIDVVADFRSRDVAAGGQGAPLVPAFHQGVFRHAQGTVCVLNLGGISNLTVLPPDDGDAKVIGFDCGPGNVLLDAWCMRHTGQAFDADGRWGQIGIVQTQLLTRLLAQPYFALQAPKSTGRDLFHLAWLDHQLSGYDHLRPEDVQATLAELTAVSCANDVKRHAFDSKVLYVCGGGALNSYLMLRLQAHLPKVSVKSSADAGLPPLQVESAAFAWLAKQTMERKTSSLSSVTGARGARVLGAIYPA